MDKLAKYQAAIIDFLTEYESEFAANSNDSLREQLSIDKERNHYQLLSIGWQKSNFIYGAILHFDILDGKVWIQQNNTELFVADELIQRGVSREDIVLGFQPPAARKHTGFAVA
jgi:hypothetical protein